MVTSNLEEMIRKASKDAALKKKEEKRKYNIEYKKANKDAIRAKRKEHYDANKDAICAKNKEYKEANKDAIRAKKSEYIKSHRDEINAYSTQYRKANKTKLQEKRKKRQRTESNLNYQSNFHRTNQSSSSQTNEFSSDFYTIDENSTPQQIRDANDVDANV